MVEAVNLHLVQNLQGVAQCFGHVAEDLVHLGLGLKPLLLGVEHARGVVEVLARRQAQQVVVSLGILLLHEVYVVGTHELDAILSCQLYQHLVGLLLHGERLAVGPLRRVLHLVALQL